MVDLKGKKALVIGALGQDGQIISLKLKQRKVSVFGATKNIDLHRAKIKGIEYDVIDLSDPESCYEYLNFLKPDFIFHFGAKNASSRNMSEIESFEPELIMDSTITLSTNLINWQLNNKKTKILVGLSSFMYAYSPTNNKIQLDSDYSPKGIYGKCNMETHKKIIEYRNKFGSDICGLILFNHTSKFSKQGFLLPDLVDKITKLKNGQVKTITIHESNKYIDISSAQNFCDGFIKIIELGLTRDFIFSSGKLVTIRSIVEEAVAAIDIGLLININFIESDFPHKPIYGDIEVTQKLLGWNPDISIHKTLLEMLE
jgi:GDP-D-mannose dehydratase